MYDKCTYISMSVKVTLHMAMCGSINSPFEML